METTIHTLIVEDSPDDAELIAHTLEEGEFNVKWERVDTAARMRDLLNKQKWNIIIADFVMPRFNGLEALKLVKEADMDVPLIIVSGTIGEDVAVEAMKAGAQDYIMKDNMIRLVSAFKRELKETSIRQNKRKAERALRQIHHIYRETIENARGIPYQFRYSDNSYQFMGKGCQELFGIEPAELTFSKMRNMVQEAGVIDPDGPVDYHEYNKLFKQWKIKKYRVDLKIKTPDGQIKWVSDRSLPIYDSKTGAVSGAMGILQDITQQKQVEMKLRESEARYRTIFENTGVATVIIEADTTLSFVNEQFEVLSGCNKNQVEVS